MEETTNGQVNGEGLPAKTPKQLKKEAEKAAKLEKFKAKQEKMNAEPAKSADKPNKKEVAAKPKAAEIESMPEFVHVLMLTDPLLLELPQFLKFHLEKRRMSQVPCLKHTTHGMWKPAGILGGKKKDSLLQSTRLIAILAL